MGKNYCKIEHKWCKYNKRGCCTYCNKNLTEVPRCPRLSEIETVRFYSLLKKVTFDDIFSAITSWFKNQEKEIEGYHDVFNTLLCMTPKKHNLSDLFINVERVVEPDGTQWLNVDGQTFDKKKTYGIEFEPWVEWVSMFVTQETLDNFSVAEIVGAALWEMTFYGFKERDVMIQREKLHEAIEETIEKTKNK